MKLFELLRAAYGTTALLAPGAIEHLLSGHAPDGRARTVIRILGARHLLQAAVAVRGSRGIHLLGSGVDLLHALTAAGLAVADERRRPAAAANAAIALAFAAGEQRLSSKSR